MMRSVMQFVVVLVLMLVVVPTTAYADYFTHRQTAAALAKEGKHAEALDAFIAMASGDVGDLRKSDALAQAVMCAIALKDYDRATELAKQIPIEPQSKLARMTILHTHANRKFAELIKQFGDEDLSRWPEHVAAKAWLMRGEAGAADVNRRELAVADLSMAVRFPMDTRTRAQTLNLLAHVHAQLGQQDEAIALYQQVCGMTDPYRAANASISLATLYVARGQPEKVAAVINAIQLKSIPPGSFRSGLLLAMGDALAAAADHDGAIALYRQAIAEHGDSEQYKATCEAKIAALQAK